MRARSGQVAVYLALVILALMVLVLMNVGSYLGVSARNTAMNGGDAAALAVARYQGELINQIGAWNVEHLKAALAGDAERCDEIVLQQTRCCFLDPIEGIRIGNEAAKRNDCDKSNEMREILATHARDVRMYYVTNPELFPSPWEGAWEEYAQKLEVAIAEGLWAGPDNIDFMNAATGHLLLNQGFYLAIAGQNWCWFHFNAPGLLSNYTSFNDWGPLPVADDETRRKQGINCEIYSLHLDVRVGSALDLLGTNLIARLTGAATEEIAKAKLLADRRQKWFFYDQRGAWRTWWELDPTGEWAFPSMGRVKSEYDVRGAGAICRTTKTFANVVQEGQERKAVWSGAAKPFGTVNGEDGELSVVTSLKGLVTDAFADVRLVPLDSIGGRDLSTANPEWMCHVRNHLGEYLTHGEKRLGGCWYCTQLITWERDSFRSLGARWLKLYSSDCIRPSGNGPGHGGSAHGH